VFVAAACVGSEVGETAVGETWTLVGIMAGVTGPEQATRKISRARRARKGKNRGKEKLIP
jgi:hypothetical protein